MMKILFKHLGLTLGMALLLTSCSQTKPSGETLTTIMTAQAEAWNQGDLDAYMLGYWNSDSLVFTGGKSLTSGYQQALDRYKKSYDSPEAMGKLEFSDVNHTFLGNQHAFTTGIWKLYRSADTLSGRYTLVWAVKNGSWKIIADHSS